MKFTYVESFTTLDECTYYIIDLLGADINIENLEEKLTDDMYFKYKDSLVLYDPTQNNF